MITKSVVLRCGPERAFELFTQQAGAWWPAERRHSKDAASSIHLEASGRFYERAADGSEIEIGVVRAFEPNRRLLLDWFPGTGSEHPTHVEVLFEPEAQATRVTVIHRAGFAGDTRFEPNAATYARSWDLVLSALSAKGAD
jgi:uncharacterized protein YndB with AHSA1/START domain